MKKKHTGKTMIFLITVIAVIILGFILFFKTGFFQNEEKSATVCVTNCLESFYDQDPFIPGMDADFPLLKEFKKHFSYNIITMEKNDEGYISSIEVKTPYIKDALQSLLDVNEHTRLTEAEIEKEILSMFQNPTINRYQVVLQMLKTKDGFRPLYTTEFLEIMSGGMLSFYNEKMEEIILELILED